MQISLPGYIDKGLALLQLVVAGVSMIFPTYNSWIGWITVGGVMLGVCFFVCHYWKIGGARSYVTLFLVCVASAAWYFIGQPTRGTQESCVGQDAQSAVVMSIEHEASSIGKPIDCITVAPPVPSADKHSAYFGEFEKAAIIWVNKFGSFYILYPDGSWLKQAQFGFCEDKQHKWCNDEESGRQHFTRLIGRVPNDKHPYRSGIAKIVDSDKGFASKIGWMEWDCEMKYNSVFYQKTDAGIVVGPFPSTYAGGYGQIFTIKNDNTFTKVNVPMDNLPCVENMGYH